jgi:hypothetical protein
MSLPPDFEHAKADAASALIDAAIEGKSPSFATGLLLLAMIEIANKQHWSSARLLAWLIEAIAAVEDIFEYKLDDEGEGEPIQ